jgi:hypothetical protein
LSKVRVILGLIAGSFLVLVITCIYEWVHSNNAGPLSRIWETALYAFAVLWASGLSVGWARVEKNTALAILFGSLLGLFAEYVGWVFFIYFLKHQMVVSPSELWATLTDIAKNGFSLWGTTTRDAHEVGMGTYTSPPGNGNYIKWSMEAIFVIGATIIGAWIGPLHSTSIKRDDIHFLRLGVFLISLLIVFGFALVCDFIAQKISPGMGILGFVLGLALGLPIMGTILDSIWNDNG